VIQVCTKPNSVPLVVFRSLSFSLSLMVRPTVSRPVCLGIKHPSGAYDQIFVTVRQLQVSCGALPLTRGQVCSLQLLLALASAVILGSESRTRILLSQVRDFPFRRLLRLVGLRWRYSTPPPHGILPLSLVLVLCYDRRWLSVAGIGNTSLKSSLFRICGNCLPKHALPWKQFRSNLYA
jgi:hypothetical protein